MLGEFKGEYTHAVDGKGRVAIPARFRAKIEHGAVLARDAARCLCVYTEETWQKKSTALDAPAPSEQDRFHRFERHKYSQASDVELDAQGRILIPLRYRQFASIGSEAVIIGARDRFEIWDAERWSAYLAELEGEDFSDLPF